jgi:hypothetical protein
MGTEAGDVNASTEAAKPVVTTPEAPKATPRDRALAKVRASDAKAAAKAEKAKDSKPVAPKATAKPAKAAPVAKDDEDETPVDDEGKPAPKPAEPPPAAAKPKDDESAARVASLSKENRELKAKLGDLEAKAGDGGKYAALKAKLKTNPAAVFDEFPELNWEALANDFEKVQADPEYKAKKAVDERVSKLEAEIRERDERDKRERAEREQTERGARAEAGVKGVIGADTDRWERVNRVPEAVGEIVAAAQKVVASMAQKAKDEGLEFALSDDEAKAIVEDCADKAEAHYDAKAKLYAKGGAKSEAAPAARPARRGITSATPSTGATAAPAAKKNGFDKQQLLARVRKAQLAQAQ